MAEPCEYMKTCPSATGWCRNGEAARKQCVPFLQSTIRRLTEERDTAEDAIHDVCSHCGFYRNSTDKECGGCFCPIAAWRCPSTENTDAPTGAEREAETFFDDAPYVRVPHSRQMALRCLVCGHTVVMSAKVCDGHACPFCRGALLPVGYVRRMQNTWAVVGVDLATGSDWTVIPRAQTGAESEAT